jgi:hypothetical protein
MAIEDITHRLIYELKSLNETNTSLRDLIKDYARTTENAMANAAATIKTNSSATTSALGDFTDRVIDRFESVKRMIGDIKDHLIGNVKDDKKTNVLSSRERSRYVVIAKIFDSILKVSSSSKLLERPDQINTKQGYVATEQTTTNLDEKPYQVAAVVFNKVMKVSHISAQLSNIHKTILDNEMKRAESQKDLERAKTFQPEDTKQITKINEPQKTEVKKEEKSNWLTNFLLSLPIIGNLFRVVKGLTTMLVSASPVISILSHFLSNEIGPLQGTIDLFAKYQLRGGKTSAEIGEIIFEKVKTIIQWPIKFLKEKLPNMFGNLKIPFAQTEKSLTNVATEGVEGLVKTGAKGGFLAKLLGSGKTGLKFLSKIPVLGGIISLYFAYDRFKKGDYVGGLIEIASAIATGTGLGAPISLGLGIWQAWRDITRTPEEEKKFKVRAEAGKDFFSKIGDLFGSMGKWISDWFSDIVNGVKKIFGFSKKNIQKIKIPNTAPEIEKLYDEKIAESEKKMKSTAMAGGNASMQRHAYEIDNLKKEKQEALKSLKSKIPENTTPLPAVNAPTTSIEKPKKNNSIQIINSGDDTELMHIQNNKLDVQTQLLQRLVKNTENSEKNTGMPINTGDVNIRQNLSDSRRHYFASSASVTNLLESKS